jgi:alkylhydroperoxidase family enzyme
MEDMSPPLASFLDARVKRLGYLGEFFQCTAHQPEALLSFLEFTEHLKHALPNNLTEVIALSIAVVMDNSYEQIQHERLCSNLGFSKDWVQQVLSLDGDRELLSSDELAVQELAVSVAKRGGRHTASEFEIVNRMTGPAKAIAVLMLIARYLSHAVIVNTLELAPPSAIARMSEDVIVRHHGEPNGKDILNGF